MKDFWDIDNFIRDHMQILRENAYEQPECFKLFYEDYQTCMEIVRIMNARDPREKDLIIKQVKRFISQKLRNQPEHTIFPGPGGDFVDQWAGPGFLKRLFRFINNDYDEETVEGEDEIAVPNPAPPTYIGLEPVPEPIPNIAVRAIDNGTFVPIPDDGPLVIHEAAVYVAGI